MEEEEGVEEAVVTDKEEESVGQKEAGGGHEHSFLCRTCSARSAKYWTTGRKQERERIIKLSRDITNESKMIIFCLLRIHRIRSGRVQSADSLIQRCSCGTTWP